MKRRMVAALRACGGLQPAQERRLAGSTIAIAVVSISLACCLLLHASLDLAPLLRPARPPPERGAAAAAAELQAAAAPFFSIGAGRRLGSSAPSKEEAHSNGSLPFPYRQETAALLASLAEVSYCGPRHDLPSWSCGPCNQSGIAIEPSTWRGVHHKEWGDTRSTFVSLARLRSPAALAEQCFIAVRGTELLSNWLTDIDFLPKGLNRSWECPGCEVMAGVLDEWMGVEDQVLEHLNAIGCGNKSNSSIVITGHSLGGAVGTIAAYALKVRHHFNVSMVYVFESPRVGNAAFSKAFAWQVSAHLPAFRITHGRDPVPHLPFENMGFRHIAGEVFYDGFGDYTICAEAEDPRCSNQYFIAASIPDHCLSPLVPSGDICSCDGWVPFLTV